MTRFVLIACYLMALGLVLSSCALFPTGRQMFGHNDGIDQNTDAAMTGALRGLSQ